MDAFVSVVWSYRCALQANAQDSRLDGNAGIAHSEEQHVPRRNGEAVDKVEAEHDSVDYPAAIRSAARNEPAETNEHYHDKASAHGAVEPTISFHFAPGAKFAPGLT